MNLLQGLVLIARPVAFGLPLLLCSVSVSEGPDEVTTPELVDRMRDFKQRFEVW